MPPELDVLDLRIERAALGIGEVDTVVPYVNGRSLLDEFDEHAGLTEVDPPDPLAGLLREGTAPVLGCGCGATACNAVVATIGFDRATSTVSWELPGLTFRFGRQQYERAVRIARNAR